MDTVTSNQGYSQEEITEDEENSQPHRSIDLRKDSKSNQSVADSDHPLIKCNLPSIDSFFFPTPSKPLPDQEDRLPQEFLNAFMKKYLEFVNEWNVSTSKDKTAPYVYSKSEKATSSKTSRTRPPKSRISIKRRQNKGVSAVYVNQWDSSMELKREKITFFEKVGEGQFGEVHKASIKLEQTTMTVAVKQLKTGSSIDDRNNFLRELATHALLEDHPNVIKLIGCCIEKEPILVVFEYMSKGNLLEFLKNSPENVASALNYVVTFGHHVAKGMEFLAATEIIHRDLAARNILINEAGMCKVADFGFAKDVFGVRKYTKKLQTAPLRWMAPESLVDGVFSTQSDVWSFGVLLWEIVTLGREVPYYNIRSNEIKKKIKDGVRLRKPGHCPTDLYEIMSNCWKADPEERLTFQRLCQEFEVLNRLGQYTPESSTTQARKSSGFYRLYNRITRQLSGNSAV
ncbi:tyrosine kinase receptor Cad96Ca-like [Anneissia japonica]|uniref:tyrosine kinase receptor Cad96Ca-like n=1 Tax=Anneissia japonica TaxID=1529436 RepID=UPI001425AC7A|nr:tyrosine kinase receptor Cad96Ca-like [Anneissia japonica]